MLFYVIVVTSLMKFLWIIISIQIPVFIDHSYDPIMIPLPLDLLQIHFQKKKKNQEIGLLI